ncbi:FecCD family ABC transporter permease [Goodfellowiella coeruleoviolacea]|uniref:Iron complex transport system permease protein n=1 Tax=Goodfellowiella coeruleoviolacea TaxID=334858 RepID=A0AAE3GG86_9PSEU|nr:iron ABC transporter permease [Goodfellowiella coeruleoviolacea]MCP2167681.1 iron complex transport system permease protein [Goodfellowiella coeruleoviolacea]
MPRTASPHLVSGAGFTVLVAVLTGGLGVAVAFAIGVGTVDVPVGEVVTVVWAHLFGGTDALDPLTDQIVWQFRAPRVLLAALAGGGLSLAGVCLQTLVRNPLADPYLFGVTAGASLGAVIALTAGAGVVAGLGVAGAAFAGALASLAAVFVLAQRGGRLVGTSLVLAGVAVAALGNAATSYLQLRANPAELRGVMFWLLGSVAGAGWPDLAAPAVATAVVVVWLFTRARPMNALSVGDDTAAGLGVNVHRLRILLLVASSLLTAAVVSAVGGIGFVGLIVPHAVRLVVGPDHRRVFPVSLVAGAVFLVLVDLVTRTVDRPNEMPVGIFTAALGAPFFLVLLRRRKRALR